MTLKTALCVAQDLLTQVVSILRDGKEPTRLPVGWNHHEAGVAKLMRSYQVLSPSEPVSLAKKTSNLFRARSPLSTPGLDVSGLTDVISIDPVARTADVQGMCTYETLVAATFRYRLVPYVVPQLKTITLGGAVTGLGVESSSFRLGLPHESVEEMDILTGSGDIITARPDGTDKERRLYRGFPNSYGTLGYAVRLRIKLEPVRKFVALRSVRFHSSARLAESLDTVVTTHSYNGEQVDYVDGVFFSSEESYLVLGRQTDSGGSLSDYTGMNIYYQSLQHEYGIKEDLMTIHDYLWRWDTDWFWCSRAFGAQNPKIRRWWPRRYLRSSVYWKFIALDRSYDIADHLEARKGLPPRERVVQDIEVTIDRLRDFLDWFDKTIDIKPVWLCPIRLSPIQPDLIRPDLIRPDLIRPGSIQPGSIQPSSIQPDPIGLGSIQPDPIGLGDDGTRMITPQADTQPWPLYPLRTGKTYVNVGFWSTLPKTLVNDEQMLASDTETNNTYRTGDWNKLIETKVSALHGHKSLYSDAYYDEPTFRQLYGGPAADQLKQEFDPNNRLAGLYEKAVLRK